jgi:3-oxoacyl-[acyl-carrier protein] reductase
MGRLSRALGRSAMIVLSGASGGLGRQLIPHLMSLDAVLCLYNSKRPSIAEDQRTILEQVNLAKVSEISALITRRERELSRITVIHLAALSIDQLAANCTEAAWDQVMNVNLKGDFLLTRHLLPLMIAERFGRIVHVSSVAGIQGRPGTLAYSASKTALFGMSRVLAKEYARFGITSNVLVLGYFESGLIDSLGDKMRAEVLAQIPSKSFGKAENIAHATRFIMNSEYLNGAVINVDGGI